jgi:hypothetical protein
VAIGERANPERGNVWWTIDYTAQVLPAKNVAYKEALRSNRSREGNLNARGFKNYVRLTRT